jgi:hypothetical protein
MTRFDDDKHWEKEYERAFAESEEIKRLRAAAIFTHEDYVTQTKCIADQHDEIERLRALVKQMGEALEYTNMHGFCLEDACGKMEEALAAYKEMMK